MRDLTSKMFEHLEITSPLDVDQSINYKQRLLRESALNKYKVVLTKCKELAKDISGYQWTLIEAKDITIERLCTWDKLDTLNIDSYYYLGVDNFVDFEKNIWLELGEIMWKKHQSVFQYQVKYIHNDILKPFRIVILKYAKRVHEMHNLSK